MSTQRVLVLGLCLVHVCSQTWLLITEYNDANKWLSADYMWYYVAVVLISYLVNVFRVGILLCSNGTWRENCWDAENFDRRTARWQLFHRQICCLLPHRGSFSAIFVIYIIYRIYRICKRLNDMMTCCRGYLSGVSCRLFAGLPRLSWKRGR